MSLSSGSLLADGLSSMYNSNPILSNITSNSNHNHYHSTNQYQQQQQHHQHHHHHAQNQLQDSHSQLLSVLFLRDLNRTNNSQTEQELPETVIPPSNFDSYSLFSFLYADNNEAFSSSYMSTNSPSAVVSPNPGFSDYDGISSNDDSVHDAFVEGSHLWSLLVVGYSLVFIIGVIGNTVLLAALCGTGSRARALPVRNLFMVNLGLADLLVTAICVPISACAAASHACWPSFLVVWMCKIGPLLQKTPVAASTLSLALLSLDRWMAIRHPRFAQRFRERRFVAMSMTIIWILASLVAAPTFWARQWDENSPISYWSTTTKQQKPSSEDLTNDWRNSSSYEQSDGGGVCVERWTNIGVQLAYVATYLGTAFVSPALIVAACHASVSHKLTAQLKILAGATSGDRFIAGRARPKQVLIVARDPSNNIIPNPLSPPGNQNGANPCGNVSSSRSGSIPSLPSRKFIPCDPNSDDEDDVFVRMQIEADLESFRQLSSHLQQQRASATPGTRRGVKSFSTFRSEASVSNSNNNNMLKASKRETSIIRAHRKLRKKLNVPCTGAQTATKLPPAPLLPTYSSQSFRSRRRAANLLAALAAVFVLCWVPYVSLCICEMFIKEKKLVRLLIPFSLFLGHAHSAINPVVSWRLNRSAFVRFQRQSILSFLPDWLRSFGTCRLFCYSCTCSKTCCDNTPEDISSTPGPGRTRTHPPPLRRHGTRYPGLNENQNPFLTSSPLHRNQRGSLADGDNPSSNQWWCGCGENTEDAIPCCCCFCPSGLFTRRSSSPDLWNRNTSTNEAALGAFHPRYLNRLPLPDPISKCHTSHFLR